MATLPTQFQDPVETRQYTIEFKADLAPGATLTGVVATCDPPGLALLAVAAGTQVGLTVSGVGALTLYEIDVTVTTTNGEVLTSGFYVRAVDR